MKSGLLLGIDLGTSRTKTGLFDTSGRLLGLASADYPVLHSGHPGDAEQDPAEWWRAVSTTIRQVLAAANPKDLLAVCVGGQGPTLVLVDAAGNPVNNAILWMDTRQREVQDKVAEILGDRFNPFSYLPKLYWLQKHRPQTVEKARWFLQAWGFITMRLCGQAVSAEREDSNPFPPAELQALGLDQGKAPPFRKMGEVIGEVTKEAAEATGLPPGLPVVAGTNDGFETHLGAGMVLPGRGIDVGGTAGGFTLCTEKPISLPGIFSFPGILPGQFTAGGVMAALGKSLDWYREAILEENLEIPELIAAADKIPPGAEGVLFLPHLAGERSPYWDEKARGAFIGLRISHTRHHLTRAILEATGYSLRQIIHPLREAGAEIEEVRSAGGQAQSQIWTQIKADILGLPISVPQVTEAAVLGAAILAGMGVEAVPPLPEGAEAMVHITSVVQPDHERHMVYSDYYQVYRGLYDSLREVSHGLTDLQERKMTAGIKERG